MNKKLLALTAGFSSWVLCTSGNASELMPVNIYQVAPNILKLSWEAQEGRSYTIEHASSLSETSWQVFSMEKAVESPMRRSLVTEKTEDYFRVRVIVETNSPPLENLVTNGDFELGGLPLPLSWHTAKFGLNGSVFTYPILGHEGNGVMIAMSDYVSGDAKWFFDDVNVSSGGTYRFSVWYTSSVPWNVTLRYLHTNGTYTYPGLLLPPVSQTWTQAQALFTIPPGVEKVTVFHTLTTNGTLTFDDVFLGQLPPSSVSLSEGLISFDFDDGLQESTMHARNILEPAGYHGTFNIVTSRVGKPGVVSENEITWLSQAGHEIAAHTIDHTNLTSIGEVELEAQLNMSRAYLLSLGVGPVESCVYTFGFYNPTVKRLTREAGYRSGSSTDSGLNAKLGFDPYVLKRTSIMSNMSLESIKQQIDAALLEKKWFIMVFHHVDSTTTDYSVSPEFLQEIVDYVQSKNAKVVTVSEGVNLLLEQ